MITGLSYGHSHSCKQIDTQTWRISWCYDYYPKGVTWRSTKRIIRDTDEKGANKFCKKWRIKIKKQPAKNR